MNQLNKTVPENNVDVILKPGELHITDKPVIIQTLLGSCLSIVLFNKRKKISAISHARLPHELFKNECADKCPVKCNSGENGDIRNKFVTCSTRYMLDHFFAKGIKKNEIEVKLFGGANVLEISPNQLTVGDRNIDAAYKVIKDYGLNLTCEDVGGKNGRTIFLYTESGTVLVRKHGKQNHPVITLSNYTRIEDKS